MFQFVAVAVLYTAIPPDAYLVDYASWPGTERTQMVFRAVTRDGKVSREIVVKGAHATAGGLVETECRVLERRGWRCQRLGETAYLLFGSADSPIRLVEFRGEGWTPTVTPIWADKK
ncbi:MAG: hypothetical protein K2X82_28025 [Gemmataceae bacterium]|nr:hypothetical protein [Gemmataceae bacterium]